MSRKKRLRDEEDTWSYSDTLPLPLYKIRTKYPPPIGLKANYLTVIGMGEPKYAGIKVVEKFATWRFRCDCGNEKDIIIGEFARGKVKSCGCKRNVRIHLIPKGIGDERDEAFRTLRLNISTELGYIPTGEERVADCKLRTKRRSHFITPWKKWRKIRGIRYEGETNSVEQEQPISREPEDLQPLRSPEVFASQWE